MLRKLKIHSLYISLPNWISLHRCWRNKYNTHISRENVNHKQITTTHCTCNSPAVSLLLLLWQGRTNRSPGKPASRRCSWERNDRLNVRKCDFVCVQNCFLCVHLPHKRGIHLHGEGVVFKRWDLREDVGEEQVDKADGDGRKILEEQTEQPMLCTLWNTVSSVKD